GRMNSPEIDDPFRVVVFVSSQSGGGAALATGYFRAGFQPGISRASRAVFDIMQQLYRHPMWARHRCG
ncbi:MAG: hypothetical protein ACYTFA_10730, partial [Planctomycetota bacterium]